MKPITFTLSFILFLTFSAEAQNLNLFKKKNSPPDVEITDVSGNNRKGKLLYGDSSSLYILTDFKDSITHLKPEQILTLKIYKQEKYIKRLGRSALSAAGLTAIFTAELYSHGDAIMVGPGFIFLTLFHFVGIPASFALTAVNRYDLNIDYNTYGKKEEYWRALPLIHVHGNTDFSKDKIEAEKIYPNPAARKMIKSPIIDKSPDRSLFAHTELLYQVHYNQFDFLFPPDFTYTGFDKKSSISGWQVAQKYQLTLGGWPKYRAYVNWNTPFSQSFANYGKSTNNRLAMWLDISQVGIGGQYLMKSVNRMNIFRKEYGLQAGLAFARIKYSTEYSINEETYSYPNAGVKWLPGVHLSAWGAYYINPHLSLKATAFGNWFPLQKFYDLEFAFEQNSLNQNINNIGIKAYNLGIALGLQIHF